MTSISNTDTPILQKNLMVTILEKIVPNVCIELDTTKFKFPNPNFFKVDFIDEHFVRSFLMKNKFEAVKDCLENIFLTKEKRDIILNYFMQAQKIYWSFKRLSNQIYFKKRIKESTHTNDLTLNPLSTHSDILKVSIIQNDVIYTFYINDLIKIINSSLTYAPDLFSEPTEPKNPYINLPFTQSNLYNIYFFIANSNKVMPKLIHAYFLCGFSIPKFHIEYESLIREEVLKNYYDDASNNKLYNDIIIMLRRYKRSCNHLKIHPEFDKTEVIKQFKHLLLHDLISQYSYQPTKRLFSKRIISRFLTSFCTVNPTFGRFIGRPFRFTIPTAGPTTSFPQIQERPRYSSNANLLDDQLADSDNVFELLEQIESVEDIAARRRVRVRRESLSRIMSRTNSEFNGSSLTPTTISNGSNEINVEGGVVTSDIESGVNEEDIEEEDIEEDDDEEEEEEEEDEDDDDDEDGDEILESDSNNLQIIGTGLGLSSFTDTGSNTIVSRYVSNRDYNSSTSNSYSGGARIEYTTHTVTRFPGRSSTLSRSSMPYYTNVTESMARIDSAISNLYSHRPPPPPSFLQRPTLPPPPPPIENIINTSNNTTSDSDLNFNITPASNVPYDASLDVTSDSGSETPPNVTNPNPFNASSPAGFNPVHDNNTDDNDI